MFLVLQNRELLTRSGYYHTVCNFLHACAPIHFNFGLSILYAYFQA